MRLHRHVLRVALALVAVSALALAAGCAGGDSKEEFAEDVRTSRDRVDDALAQVTDATSFDDLLRRLRTGASEVRGAADELDEAGPPEELEAEASELVASYRALSVEMTNTATALDDVTTERSGAIQEINFNNWNRTQRALAALRQEDVDVQPLNRHGT